MWSLLTILFPLKFLWMHRQQMGGQGLGELHCRIISNFFIFYHGQLMNITKHYFCTKLGGSWGEGADKNMGRGLTKLIMEDSILFSAAHFLFCSAILALTSILFYFFIFVHSYLQGCHLYFLLIWKQTWRNISWIPRLCQFMTFIRRKGIRNCS